MESKVIVSNLLWRFLERIGAQLVSFVISISLARLLDPSAYGTVALMMVFLTIMQVFVDSGLGNALIQKKGADDLDFSTVFYTNILFCIILYTFIYFISPMVANFYDDMHITAYMRVLGLSIIISGIKNVQQAYVSKNMLFKKFFFSTLGGTITAGIVGIIMAYNGFGVWSLIIQQIVNLSIDTIVIWITVDWRPKLEFSFSRLTRLYSYGWKLLVSSFLETIYSNLRQLIIGRIYSSSDLAYYNRGMQMPNLIIQNINTSIDSVLLPAMSKEQDRKLKVKQMTRKAIKVSTYVMSPIMIGLIVVAEPLILLLLTEKWLPSIFYMRVFCLAFMFQPIHTANLNAIKALGRSDLFLKLEIIKKIIGIILLVSSMFISVKALVLSFLMTSILSQIVNSWPNKKILDYSYTSQLNDIFPSIVLSIFMGIIIYPLQYLKIDSLYILGMQVISGLIIYILGSKILKLDTYMYLKKVVLSFVQKKVKL